VLLFMAGNLEQLDLAREHIALGDPNNARFGLMLTDNAVEITLHRVAKDYQIKVKSQAHYEPPFPHMAELMKALGQDFGSKVRFAKTIGMFGDDDAQTAVICHSFRNEVYHVGAIHEEILPDLARFYFDRACAMVAAYKGGFIGWGSGDVMPKRAERFFTGHHWFPGNADQYRQGCATLAQENAFNWKSLVNTLAKHMSDVVDDQDSSIDLMATGAPTPMSRDQVVIFCQAWELAFDGKGLEYAQQHGFSGSKFELVEWLKANYPFAVSADPIPSWRQRAAGISGEKAAASALNKYHQFMQQTEELRENLYESAGQLQMEIDRQIEDMRGR